METKKSSLPLTFFLVSLFIFFFSILFDAFYVDKTPSEFSAFSALLLGWAYLGGPGISWVGNVFLWISYLFILKRRTKTSAVLSFIAVSFMLSFLFFDTTIVSENNFEEKITGYGLGYYMWLSSGFIILIGSLYLTFKKNLN
ncbi:hypothetical protein [Chryseobacterium sp.]|uniref:hypothetical protein n=1 Tax=Chryseobacterium sp. TaxID=1871047 RepID=UPI0011CC7FC5|nr:hypothetical protein [Chryseobacterium sp.]TXF76248.1 hypothetical protein FUA25_10210 [Chryseobacterium sp.]